MHPFLIKIAQFIARRPKDSTIRMIRILTGLVMILVFALLADNFILQSPIGTEKMSMIFRSFLIFLGWVILFRGVVPVCLVKHEHLRIAQGVFGIFLLVMAVAWMDDKQASQAVQPISMTVEAPKPVRAAHNPDWVIILLSFPALFFGITGKWTTSTCLKYGQKITKIRI